MSLHKKYNVPVKKKRRHINTCLFLSFFLFLLIHGTLSFLPKDFFCFFVFYIEILRHFSNPALVYNTGCSDQQMNGGNTEGLMPQACTENGTPGVGWLSFCL